MSEFFPGIVPSELSVFEQQHPSHIQLMYQTLDRQDDHIQSPPPPQTSVLRSQPVQATGQMTSQLVLPSGHPVQVVEQRTAQVPLQATAQAAHVGQMMPHTEQERVGNLPPSVAHTTTAPVTQPAFVMSVPAPTAPVQSPPPLTMQAQVHTPVQTPVQPSLDRRQQVLKGWQDAVAELKKYTMKAVECEIKVREWEGHLALLGMQGNMSIDMLGVGQKGDRD